MAGGSQTSSADSVSQWLENLKRGESRAAQKLWERYVERLIRLARKELGDVPRRVADEEDVVVAAFANFCRGVKNGRFPKLDDRDDLWQVLVMLTERKAIDQRRRLTAERRGGGDVRGESAVGAPHSTEPQGAGLAGIPDREPTPAFAAMVAEQFDRLLARLNDETLQRIALDKMAGYTNEEIAERLGTALRNIERRLQLTRRIWSEDQGP